MKQLTLLITTTLLTLLSVLPVFADTTANTPNCQPIYGGGQTCVTSTTIAINKTVQNPETKSFVDNLNNTDPKYGPNQIVAFKLEVTNKSGNILKNIRVQDIFPQYVTFDKGPGKFDTTTRTLTFTIDSLEKDETRTYDVTGKTDAVLPNDNSIICVANQASATAGNQTGVDTVKFCLQNNILSAQAPMQTQSTKFPSVTNQKTITKGGITVTVTPTPSLPLMTKGGTIVYNSQPTKKVPATGAETLPMFALLPAGIAGLILRGKAIFRRG